MSSRLSHVPIAARRKLAATLALFTMLFVAIGAVAATGRGSAAAPVFSAVALAVAVLLGLIALGIARSVKIDLAEQRLDDVLRSAVGGCGHDHDPSELTVTDCPHDGTGAHCSHDCQACVLAALRPSPSRTRAERAPRPS